MLALWAIVGSAASHKDAVDGRLAAPAGLAGALVDAVLELKETAHAVGVDIIGDRGAAQPDGVLENLAQCLSEPVELS